MGTRSNLFAKTFPTNATSKENIAPGVHPEEGGLNPTVALQGDMRMEVTLMCELAVKKS